MKKQILILIACIVIAAGLGGTLWFLMGYEPADDAEASSSESTIVKLSEKSSYDLDTLHIQNETDEYTMKNLGDNKFQIESMPDVAIASGTLSSMASSGAAVTATSIVNEKPDDLAVFGLDKPRVTFTSKFTDGSTLTVQLGNDAPAGSGVYGKLPDSDTVYLLSKYSFEKFFQSPLSFIGLVITEQPDPNYQQNGTTILPDQVTLGGSVRPEPIVMKRDLGETESDSSKAAEKASYNINTYLITSPKSRPVDTGTGTDALVALMSITADSVAAYRPTDAQMGEFGLDEPYSTAAFTYMDAEQKQQSVSLKVSAADASGSAYLIKEGVPLVYKVAVANLPWYPLTYPDLLSTLQILPYIDSIKSMNVQFPDKSYLLELSGESDALKVQVGGSFVNTDLFRKFYQAVIGVPSEDYTEDQPAAGAKPLLRVTYSYRDGTASDTVEFFEGPTRKVFLSVNGEIEFYTKASYLDTIRQNVDRLIEGKDILPLY